MVLVLFLLMVWQHNHHIIILAEIKIREKSYARQIMVNTSHHTASGSITIKHFRYKWGSILALAVGRYPSIISPTSSSQQWLHLSNFISTHKQKPLSQRNESVNIESISDHKLNMMGTFLMNTAHAPRLPLSHRSLSYNNERYVTPNNPMFFFYISQKCV